MGKFHPRLPSSRATNGSRPAEKSSNCATGSTKSGSPKSSAPQGRSPTTANGYRYYGWQRDEDLDGWWFREWLPGAQDVYLFGDFNGWQRNPLRLDRDRHGVWSAFFPDAMFADRLVHGSLYKIHVHGANGWHDCIPAYAARVVQDERTKDFAAQFLRPQRFDWGEAGRQFDPARNGAPLIYEAHAGMAQEREGVGTFAEFTGRILPAIREAGYNTVQLMAVAEHPTTGRSATTCRVLRPHLAVQHAQRS